MAASDDVGGRMRYGGDGCDGSGKDAEPQMWAVLGRSGRRVGLA
jgi:hypothetical protein